MSNSDYIKIFTGSFITVQRIVSDLEKTSISPVVKDQAESARLAGFGATIQGQQELYVHKDELDRAVEIVESITSKFQD